ncbi:MAG TPA: aldose 1-epimerase [Chitinophagaceae bacterium]
MPFEVSRSVQNNITIIHLRDNNHSTAISIIPSVGAMLHEFSLPVKGRLFNIIENYSLDKPLKKQVTNYFRSVKLSPWVCRLNNGRYHFNGSDFQVRRMHSDGTALHGLLFDQPFTIEEETANETSASILLKHTYKGYDPGYPFEYHCEVRYTLHPEHVLEVETVITNNHSGPVPVSDGWHPYFRLGGKVDGWKLYINAEAMVEFNEKLIPTGKLLPFNQFNKPSVVGSTQMDNCFLLKEAKNGGACSVLNPANGLQVSFHPVKGYPYLQVFIPSHRKSIAVENISGAPDSFNNRMGELILQPGESKTFRVFYRAGVKEKS